MRLTHFKSQGFKSFADAVSFSVHDGLTGIVGPNGCGKSNVVDAVRWVLGESYAGALRIKSLPDVLFNGSEKRAPTDWCSVELRFANDSSRDLGEWKSFSEIAVRRELSRDGQSYFYINNNAVRRRDVVDLFRGTGVSPRAYGVVEQGMIGAIAEASADELRLFLEEAAGVSHYKERRRDAERRLAGCLQNLQQVSLLLADLDKRVESLKRQARTAVRHQKLGDEINELETLLISRRCQEMTLQREAKQKQLQATDDDLQTIQHALQKTQTALRAGQVEQRAILQSLQTAQGELATLQTAAGVVLRDMENAAQNRLEAQKRLAAEREELQKVNAAQTQLGADIKKCLGETTANDAALKNLREQEQKLLGELNESQQSIIAKQQDSEQERNALSDAKQQLEGRVLQEKMLGEQAQTLRQKLDDGRQTLQKLIAQTAGEPGVDLREEETAVAVLESEKQKHNEAIKIIREELQTARATARNAQEQLVASRAKKDAIDAVLKDDGNWPGDAPPRLSQVLKVRAGDWARALDAALGLYAGAFAVDKLQAFYEQHGLPPVGNAVVETADTADESENESPPLPLKKLLQVINISPSGKNVLSPWLSKVYVADDEKTAWLNRDKLLHGQAVATKNGAVITRHSVFVHGEVGGGYNWQQKTAALKTLVGEQTRASESAKKRLEDIAGRHSDEEKKGEVLNQKIESAKQILSDKQIELSGWRAKQSAARQRRDELENELQTADADLRAQKTAIAAVAAAKKEMNAQFERAQNRFETVKNDLQTMLQQIEQQRQAATQVAVQHREAAVSTENSRRRHQDFLARDKETKERRTLLETRISRGVSEVEKHDDAALRRQAKDEQTKVAAAAAKTQKITAAEQTLSKKITAMEEKRDEHFRQSQTVKDKKSSLQMEARELTLTIERLNDSLADFAVGEERLKELLAEKKDAATCQNDIEELKRKRDKLGAINFAADNELRERQTRRDEMDSQRQDIESGVEELQSVMRRIDDETRARLKKMFTDINREFDGLYKQLFGGGGAKLEMSGDSVLDAGFEIRAQPPGKRLFSIRALSGGEKSATALAFVFAMLKLTPPPFCILDEVDAALDEERSNKFVSCLLAMEKTIQCLIVTHNKSTIESMSRLIGVTQEERGVSKIVAVNLRQATALAAT